MDPVFTLQWSEFVVAERLQRHFKKSDGYCVLIPTSRQEEGIDLALLKKTPGHASRVVTVQVKASKTYHHAPPKKDSVVRSKYGTWFNRFEVPKTADFVLLFGLYAPDPVRTRHVTKNWYESIILLFTNAEMRQLMEDCKTVAGRPDRMFGFGFDDPTEICQTRGDGERRRLDFSNYLLDRRFHLLEKALEP